MSYIDEYLSNISDKKRRVELERIRLIVHKTVKNDITEIKSYGIPTFRYKDKYLLAFAEFKNHLSIFPGSTAIETYKAELKEYKIARGTIQFDTENPLPESLIKAIILARKAEIN